MKIAINATPAFRDEEPSSLRSMLLALEARGDSHRWYVYAPPETIEELRGAHSRLILRKIEGPGGMLGRLYAAQILVPRLMRRDGIDLVYSLNCLDSFLATRPRIVAMPDADAFLFRNFQASALERLRWQARAWLTRRSLASADHVTCFSGFDRDVVQQALPECELKNTIVPPGIGDPFRPGTPRPQWAPEGFLFTVGAKRSLHGLHTVLEAYSHCRKQGLRLPLLVGLTAADQLDDRRLRRAVDRLGLKHHVEYVMRPESQVRAGLMAHATLFLYTGVLEGSRSTLYEAMRCGAAIVAQETPLNREVAGDAVAWCEAGLAWSMTRTIQRVVANSNYAGALRKKAAVRVAGYSWEATATSLVKLFERTSADYRQPEVDERPEAIVARIRDVTQ